MMSYSFGNSVDRHSQILVPALWNVKEETTCTCSMLQGRSVKLKNKPEPIEVAATVSMQCLIQDCSVALPLLAAMSSIAFCFGSRSAAQAFRLGGCSSVRLNRTLSKMLTHYEHWEEDAALVYSNLAMTNT